MKVRIKLNHNDWSCKRTGKGYFLSTLIPELIKLGIDVTEDLEERVDIDFHIGKFVYEPVNCKKTIVRYGPIHIDTNKNWPKLNKRKFMAYRKADGVIFQSKFAMKMIKAFFKDPPGKSAIINNGAKLTDNLYVDRSNDYYKYNFITSARVWTKQKRLSSIIRAYWKADIKNSILWVVGENGSKNGGSRDQDRRMEARKVGLLPHDELLELYQKCDAMIHMVWLDAMPNCVCEAIANGCKIICNNAAGTKEVVQEPAFFRQKVLKTDPKWDRKPVNTNKPPIINDDMLAQAFKDILNYPKPDTDLVDIRNVAVKYNEFFKEVLA